MVHFGFWGGDGVWDSLVDDDDDDDDNSSVSSSWLMAYQTHAGSCKLVNVPLPFFS